VKLSFEHSFDVAAAALFAFHENPGNLVAFLRGWTTFRMVANDGHIRVGSVTRVQERIGPLWIPMTFEHFLYEPPRRFGERQVRGPFKKLEHVHEFESRGSRTILRDSLDVILPWYLGGSFATRWIVVPKFRRFFAYRHAEIDRMLKAGKLT
jgi:uncharacterized protein